MEGCVNIEFIFHRNIWAFFVLSIVRSTIERRQTHAPRRAGARGAGLSAPRRGAAGWVSKRAAPGRGGCYEDNSKSMYMLYKDYVSYIVCWHGEG